MNSLTNIIQPVIFNGPVNIYSLGLSLKNGQISKIKIYNKIYQHSDKYHNFLKGFGGDFCLQSYKTTDEWKNLYPGFSGFTVGVEIRDHNQYRYAFGYKDKGTEIVFKAYYLNFTKSVVKAELYRYVSSHQLETPKKKMRSDLLEVKDSPELSYCYCPFISHTNITEIEDDVRFSLTEKNRPVFDSIKKAGNFSILNYGLNSSEEKIYMVSTDDNKDIHKISDLLSRLNERKLLTSFSK